MSQPSNKTTDVNISTERSLSRWIPSGVAVLGFAVGFGASYNTISSHVEDESVHMPYEKRIETFVPRAEVENMIKLLHDSVQLTIQYSKESDRRTEADIQRIEEKLDRIEELLITTHN